VHLACRLANFHAGVVMATGRTEFYALTANMSHIGAALFTVEAEAV